MRLSIIVAMGKNRAIGIDGKLPWPNISEDKKRFRNLTIGHTVIMGSKTFDSIGKPLPDRTNIILSRKNIYEPDALVMNSLDKALKVIRQDDEVFVIGGGQVYKQVLSLADRLYITEVDISPIADAFFPKFDENDFKIIEETHHVANEKNSFATTFKIYSRKKSRVEKD